MYGVETIEATIRHRGFQYRIQECINPSIENIQKDTEIAVKKAIEAYDFETAIIDQVNTIINNKINSVVNHTVEREIYKMLPTLEHAVVDEIKHRLNVDGD